VTTGTREFNNHEVSMKYVTCLTAAGLLGLAAAAWGGDCKGPGCGPQCKEIPPPDCPDCGSCPCDKRLFHHCSAWKTEHAHKLIEQLHCDDSCERIKAASKLGSCLHADFCCDPEVLDALADALLGDPCWEVRRAAAWSITRQHARVDQGVMALYISSRMDPHYMVRDKAAESLDILLLCRRECYKELFKSAEVLIVELRKNNFRPGHENSRLVLANCYTGAGMAGAVGATPPETVPGRDTETLPPPGTKPEPLPPPKESPPAPREKLPAPKEAKPMPKP